MNELILFISVGILCICLFFIFIYYRIASRRCKRLNTSCDRMYDAQNVISKLDTIIETCVMSVNQKMVSTLKENNIFVQSDKEEAFNECKNMVNSMTPYTTLETLGSLGMDTNGWINARIEYFVRKHKSNI